MSQARKRLVAAIKNAAAEPDPDKVDELARQLAENLRAGQPKKPRNIKDAIDAAVQAGDADLLLWVTDRFSSEVRANPAASPAAFVASLKAATESFDRRRAAALCRQLVDHLRLSEQQYDFEQSKRLLGLLRRKRYFDMTIAVADALIQSGQDDANIRRQYAQALIDTGKLTAGREVLQSLEQDCVKDRNAHELAEARGLIGRAYKQMYMDTAKLGRPGPVARQHLKSSIAAYNQVYSEDKSKTWHGINIVALVKRAARDRAGLGKAPIDAAAAAGDILRRIAAKKDKANLWDCATAAEACLALGKERDALKWMLKYTVADNADAFEFASTLRQFEEVWGLSSATIAHARILQPLRAALLRQEGGSIQLADPSVETAAARRLVNEKTFEKVLGADRYRTFKWYATGIDRASGVAKVRDRFGNALGTGFLVPGSQVHSRIAEPWVLFTNAHVISDDPAEQQSEPRSIPPDEARIVFEAGPDTGREFVAGELVFTSPRNELDCSVVTLSDGIAFDQPFSIARRPPLVGKNQRVYVIGYPRGGGLSFSIDDNLLLDHELPKIHYRAPTEGGSSGSPVFNQSWDLVALHHAGSMEMKKLNNNPGFYPANEGISIQSIFDAIARKLG